jgi:transcription termination factor Rho
MRRMYDLMVQPPPAGGGLDPSNVTEQILDRLRKTANNQEFLERLNES